MIDGCSPSSESSKRMRSVSESDLSYCTAPENIRQFTTNAVTRAYM